MSLKQSQIIDATNKGSYSRFINHSCDPNCETQKWTVNGKLRIGIFSKKRIPKYSELTFDYQSQRYGREPQKCFCSSANCRGYIDKNYLPATTVSPLLNNSYIPVNDNNDDNPITNTITKRNQIFSEDPYLEEEIEDLFKISNITDDSDIKISEGNAQNFGLQNSENMLKFCRLMIRTEKPLFKIKLLKLLKFSRLDILTLFINLQGLNLMWTWMASIPDIDRVIYPKDSSYEEFEENIVLSFKILEVLLKLPITTKESLEKSKIPKVLEKWASMPHSLQQQSVDIEKLTTESQKVLEEWNNIKEIYKIPKKKDNASEDISRPMSFCNTDKYMGLEYCQINDYYNRDSSSSSNARNDYCYDEKIIKPPYQHYPSPRSNSIWQNNYNDNKRLKKNFYEPKNDRKDHILMCRENTPEQKYNHFHIKSSYNNGSKARSHHNSYNSKDYDKDKRFSEYSHNISYDEKNLFNDDSRKKDHSVTNYYDQKSHKDKRKAHSSFSSQAHQNRKINVKPDYNNEQTSLNSSLELRTVVEMDKTTGYSFPILYNSKSYKTCQKNLTDNSFTVLPNYASHLVSPIQSSSFLTTQRSLSFNQSPLKNDINCINTLFPRLDVAMPLSNIISNINSLSTLHNPYASQHLMQQANYLSTTLSIPISTHLLHQNHNSQNSLYINNVLQQAPQHYNSSSSQQLINSILYWQSPTPPPSINNNLQNGISSFNQTNLSDTSNYRNFLNSIGTPSFDSLNLISKVSDTSTNNLILDSKILPNKGKLPENWKIAFDNISGKPYYYHKITKQVQWDFPIDNKISETSSSSTSPNSNNSENLEVKSNKEHNKQVISFSKNYCFTEIF
ncbi:unnamed protein product [Gordionus sp. m RMFG-2023]